LGTIAAKFGPLKQASQENSISINCLLEAIGCKGSGASAVLITTLSIDYFLRFLRSCALMIFVPFDRSKPLASAAADLLSP
jgi:hypothetical protein